MRFWARRESYISGVSGFVLGQCVTHVLGDMQAVIVGFKYDEYGPMALCVMSPKADDEIECHLCELKAADLKETP